MLTLVQLNWRRTGNINPFRQEFGEAANKIRTFISFFMTKMSHKKYSHKFKHL
jgi:hypothetical protein